MTLTIALLLIAGANLGILLLIKALLSYVHAINHNQSTAEATRRSFEQANLDYSSKLSKAMRQAFDATGKLIIDSVDGSAKDTQSLKRMLTSIRHDMAIDRQGLDSHDEASRNRQAELVGYVQREGVKTRKEIKALVEEGGRIISYYSGEQSKLRDSVHQESVHTRETVELEHKVTRQRISQVKTRLADEERVDRETQAKARRARERQLKSK